MNIKVLGSGCSKCVTLEEHVKQALNELGKSADIEKISDVAEITKYNVLKTPALVVDGEVVSSGSVVSVEGIKSLLE